MTLEEKIEQAIWICKTLFEQGKVTGSTSNLSFRHDDEIYITGTNVSFSRINKEDFSRIDFKGNVLSKKKPSKEYPMHLLLYRQDPSIGAVIHTHSFYSTLLSIVTKEVDMNCVPSYTPYLQMKVGDIALVEYAPPGSTELFNLFEKKLDQRRGYLLQNHGSVIAGKDLLQAFYGIEELEESCRLAWELRNEENVILIK